MEFEERCHRLTEIAVRVVDFATISSAAELEVHAAGEAAFRKALARGASLLPVLAARGAVKGMSAADLAKVLSEQTLASAEKVLSAACIVLAHSIVDDIFSACCALAIECDPKGWLAEVDLNRPVILREILEKGADEILQQELRRLAAQLRGKSLPNRADILFRHAPIAHHRETVKSDPDYFRLSTLKELDELRHDIVHKGGVSRVDVSKTVNNVAFFQEAASTAVRTMCNAYECGVSNPYMEELLQQRNVNC